MENFASLIVGNREACECWLLHARTWWAVIIVAATLMAGLMLLLKFILKHSGKLRDRTWSKVLAYMFIFIGLFPLFALLLSWYFFTSDGEPFREVIMISGLLAGTVMAWAIYLFLMLVGHLGGWRRDLL